MNIIISCLFFLFRFLFMTGSLWVLMCSCNRVISRVPNLVIKMVVRLWRLRCKIIKVFCECINTHLSDTLTISATDIDTSFFSFFLTSNENVIPLVKLGISNFLIQLSIRTIQFNFKSGFVKVKHDTVAILNIFFRDGNNDCLSWGKEERPLTSQMFNKYSYEPFNRS